MRPVLVGRLDSLGDVLLAGPAVPGHPCPGSVGADAVVAADLRLSADRNRRTMRTGRSAR